MKKLGISIMVLLVLLVGTVLAAAPVFTTTGPTTAIVGVAYAYDADATDADIPADTLTFSLSGAPTGMSINSASGIVAWTPVASQVGTQTYTVSVTDGTTSVPQLVSVVVTANQPPTITSTPSLSATVGSQYTYTVTATDPESQTLTYSLFSTLETGMSFTPATRMFTWTPTSAQEGLHAITLRVADPLGNTNDQTFQLNVTSIVTQYRNQLNNYSDLFDEYDNTFSSIQDDVDNGCDDYQQAIEDNDNGDKRNAERDLSDSSNDLDDLESDLNDLEDDLKSLKRDVRDLPTSNTARDLERDVDNVIQDDVNGLQDDIRSEQDTIRVFCVATPATPTTPVVTLPQQTVVAQQPPQPLQTAQVTTTVAAPPREQVAVVASSTTQQPAQFSNVVPNRVQVVESNQTDYTTIVVMVGLGLLLVVLLVVMLIVLARR